MRSAVVCLFLLLLACSAPSRYLGTEPSGDGATGNKAVLLRGTGYMNLRKFDSVSIYPLRYYSVFVEPGKHKASIFYNDGTFYSTEDAETEFSAKAGETVMLCYVPTGLYSWTVLPLIAVGQNFEERVFVAPEYWFQLPENPTCRTWGSVANGSDDFVERWLNRGVVTDFKTMKGQTLLQFAQAVGNPKTIKILQERGFH